MLQNHYVVPFTVVPHATLHGFSWIKFDEKHGWLVADVVLDKMLQVLKTDTRLVF